MPTSVNARLPGGNNLHPCRPSRRTLEAIEAVIAGTREQFPGHIFRLLGNVDAHHDIVRFGWELVPEGGDESVVAGFDVAVVTENGYVRNVYGFLDKVPGA